MPTECSVAECRSPVVGQGLCNKHYKRMRKNGSLQTSRLVGATDEERFWTHVAKGQPVADCWRWGGGLNAENYGVMYTPHRSNRQVMAHRFAYELMIGPIPDGFTLDHTCHTADTACRGGKACMHRRCVNPGHATPRTLAENIRLGGNGRKTHCKRGHEFTDENTYVMAGGGRCCRPCRRLKDRQRPARR